MQYSCSFVGPVFVLLLLVETYLVHCCICATYVCIKPQFTVPIRRRTKADNLLARLVRPEHFDIGTALAWLYPVVHAWLHPVVLA